MASNFLFIRASMTDSTKLNATQQNPRPLPCHNKGADSIDSQPLIQIWSADFSGRWSDAFFAEQLRKLSSADQDAIVRYRRWEDQQLKLLGRLLLATALESLGCNEIDITSVTYSGQGKPHLQGGPNFNISHSGSRAVCAISSGAPVGIDLEYYRQINLDDYLPVLSPTETARTRSARDISRAFFDLWTAKESVCKADGRGFSIDLKQINPSGNCAYVQDTRYQIYPVVMPVEDYVCCVATTDNNCLLQLRNIEIRALP